MDLRIAPATADEAPLVAGLLREAAEWLRSQGQEMWLAHEVSVERVAPDVEAGSFLLARIGELPVGVVKYQLNDELFWPDIAPGSSAFIHRLAVDRRWAGQGISSALIDHAADLARQDGREWLRLDCSSDRLQLRAFYERAGFRLCGYRQVKAWHVALYERPTVRRPEAQSVAEFMRFSAADPAALARGIEEMRVKLAAAMQAGESLAIVDAAADLGSMLTTARQEAEAVQLLQPLIAKAEAHAADEPAGWFWNSYATALQYCGEREQAEGFFCKAIALARAGAWHRLEALALHHWGRSLAEQRRVAEAQSRFAQALALRVALNEPSQASSRRALAQLSALQDGPVAGQS